jgi:hypothetical protein
MARVRQIVTNGLTSSYIPSRLTIPEEAHPRSLSDAEHVSAIWWRNSRSHVAARQQGMTVEEVCREQQQRLREAQRAQRKCPPDDAQAGGRQVT